jgi:hypothetical protein
MCKQVINFDFFVNLVSHNQEPAVIVLDREEQLFPFCPTFLEFWLMRWLRLLTDVRFLPSNPFGVLTGPVEFLCCEDTLRS